MARTADRAVEADTVPDEAPEVQDELGWSLHRLSTAYRRTASTAVADLPGGARGYQVLLTAAGGPAPSQLALAQSLGIDRTAMTYLVDELEAAGLVVRRADPADRRVRRVTVTAEGRHALGRARQALGRVEERLLGELSAQDAALLRDLLTRVAMGLEVAEACAAPGQPPGRA